MVRKTLLRISIIFFVVFLSFSYSLAMGQRDQGILINEPAPNFSLSDLDGNKVELASFKGKNVILFFWATWCHFCRKSLVDLETRYPVLKDKGIVVLGIDIEESSQGVKNFLQKYPASFPVLLDVEGGIAEEYNVIGIPTYVFIDAKGNIKSTDNSLPGNYTSVFK